MKTLIVITLALALAACGADTTAEPLTNDDFAPELNVNLDAMTKTASGLYIQDLTVGTGDEATSGTTVIVHYEGSLSNGTKFDSSRDRNEPFSFLLGAGRVIRGWDEGVAGMRVGGFRKLVIPPALGYGVGGSLPTIPGNATLVFDIELLEVM